MIKKTDKIFVAGHKGLVGSAIIRKLKDKGYSNIITVEKKNLNLISQEKVISFLKKKKPRCIFLAAAKVGGIYSNKKFKADYIYENLMIQSNIIHGAYKANIKNLIFLGSSCIYPKLCKQPIKEDYFLSGKLEETNDAYAIAKIAGIKMCQSYNFQYKTNYKSLMPTNTFGPNDNYHKLNSHFIPALLRKIYQIEKSKTNIIKIWGDGSPRREIIYSEDIADACIFFMNKKTRHSLINIGTGKDFKIKEYVRLFLKILLPKRKIKIVYDKSKPNGTPRKVLDVGLAKKYGWKAKTSIKDAVLKTYHEYKYGQKQ
jgi:GDP-L-fucose synthase